jgi:putative ABC transport system permease protein
MILNNLKIAWRSLLKNTTFSLINIIGLAIAMAASMLISIWVMDEYNCDKGHINRDRIYEVYNKYEHNGKIDCWNVTPKPMAKALKADYPEIEQACRVNWPKESLFTYKDKKLKAVNIIVDSNFFDVFTFPLVKGHKSQQLKNPYSIAITESLAKSLFDNEDAIGKANMIDHEPYTVAGVVKDYKDKSRFKFSCLIPWSSMRLKNDNDENWSNNSTMTYVLLYENIKLDPLQEKLKTLRKKYDKNDGKMVTFLYPLTRARLYGRFQNGIEVGDRVIVVKMLSIVSLLILLIACINFMNLSTARSDKRAKEVGVRKVAGASKKSLILQFLIESVMTAMFSFAIALILVKLSFSFFNDLAGKNLIFDFSSWKIIGAACIFSILTGLLAGSYPSWYLSTFDPIVTLKGSITPPKTLITPRKILILLQFIFSTFLITSTIIINKELRFVQERDAGYDNKELVYHFLEGDMDKNFQIIKDELLREGIANSVTKTSAPITEAWSNSDGMNWVGKDQSQNTLVDRYCADDKVVKTLGFKLLAGRDLDLASYMADSTSMIINKSMAKLMGHQNPEDALGKEVFDNNIGWKVVGVIEDFVIHSPFGNTSPLVIEGAKGWFNIMHVRYSNQLPIRETLAKAKKIFSKYNPAYPFDYKFVDEAYAKKFEDAKKIAKMSSFFAGFSIFISCLGLFGLISFMALNRRKEIAIRKVNGASVANLLSLISTDFVKIIMAAYIIAIPITYHLMKKWLMQYKYQIDITWSIFVFAAIILSVITIMTIGYQTVKAAMANPVNSLRSE